MFFLKFHIFFDTSKCATNYRNIFEAYDGFIGQKILKLWRQESWPFGPNPAQISIPVLQKSFTEGLLYIDRLKHNIGVVLPSLTWLKWNLYLKLQFFGLKMMMKNGLEIKILVGASQETNVLRLLNLNWSDTFVFWMEQFTFWRPKCCQTTLIEKHL